MKFLYFFYINIVKIYWTNILKNYSFGKIQLRKREIELIKLIKKYINEERNIYPVKKILAPNNNLMRGLRTNYIFYTSKVFKN